MQSFFTSDIQQLNTLYNRPQFSFIFLYGRFDTGKTSLVREFCQNKKTLFYSAQETEPKRQLALFWQETIRALKPAKEPPLFANWEQAFSYIGTFSFSKRLVFVLDEFQLLEQHSDGLMEAFKTAVTRDFISRKIFLILTCSSISYAGKLLQEPVAQPFHAITAKAFLRPLPFYSCRPFLSGYSPKEQLLLYGITGGLPSYLKYLNPKRTAQENAVAMLFEYQSPLFMKPLSLLHRELRETSTYNLLLEIMASGRTKLIDIATEASIGTNKCAKYLNSLIDIGMICKEFPAVGEIQKKVRYIFTDPMLRFWYRYVYPNTSGILAGQGREIFKNQVLPTLDEYLLPVFETVCAEALEKLASARQTPFAYRHTGSWWTGGTKREPFFRIPLVAIDASHAVLGICHCSAQPAGIQYLNQLNRPLEPFGDLHRYCCIFSTSGFDEQLKQAAASEKNVWLVDLEDIVSR